MGITEILGSGEIIQAPPCQERLCFKLHCAGTILWLWKICQPSRWEMTCRLGVNSCGRGPHYFDNPLRRLVMSSSIRYIPLFETNSYLASSLRLNHNC